MKIEIMSEKMSKAQALRWMLMSPEERQKLSQAMSQGSLGKNAKSFSLLSPTGELVEGRNLSQFCKDHPDKLDESSLRKVLKGEASHHKGWRWSS